MTRRLKKLVKYFEFHEANRSRLTLGAGTRLGITESYLHLMEDDDLYYPITDDITAKTWIANPNTVKQWLGFEAVVSHAKDETGTTVTSDGYRLSDGTEQYWYNGAAWEINVVDWNTEAEVANNISTFPATEEKIQVIVNLKTTDKKYTPIIESVKILYSTDVEFWEDLIHKSLVPLMRENIEPIAAYPIIMAENSNTIDLADDYKLEVPYNVTEIDSVYDHTNDPEHTTDLFSSYNSTTQIITLSSALDADEIAWIRFVYEPEIVVTSDREYYEIGKVPMILLSSITLQDTKAIQQRQDVKNKDQLTAVQLDEVLQGDVRINLTGVTESSRDHNRMKEGIQKFFKDNVVLNSLGIDEEYRMYILDEPTQTTSFAGSEKHMSEFAIIISKVVFWLGEPEDKFIVNNFKIQGDLDITV